MGEDTNLVVHQVDARAVVAVQRIERHVAAYIERSGIVLEARQVHGIGAHHVQFRLFSHGRRVICRLHAIVMAEVRIVLCLRPQRDDGTQNQQPVKSSKHNEITQTFLIYCIVRLI